MNKQILSTVLLASLLTLPMVAVAQQRGYQQERFQSPPFRNQEPKSVSKARNIALTNTVMPVATGLTAIALFDNRTIQTSGALLAVYGLSMGPSTGNFYAEDYTRGFLGLGMRAAGLFLMHDATREVFGSTFANRLTIDDRKVRLTDTKMLIGEALILGSAIYNILSAKKSVQKYQESRRKFAVSVSSASIKRTIAPLLTARINF